MVIVSMPEVVNNDVCVWPPGSVEVMSSVVRNALVKVVSDAEGSPSPPMGCMETVGVVLVNEPVAVGREGLVFDGPGL